MQAVEMSEQTDEAAVAAHYGKLLGISRPWKVLTAQLDLLAGKVAIEVGWDESVPVVCPECGQECAAARSCAAAGVEASERDAVSDGVRARVPRCQCPEHGVQDDSCRGRSRARALRCILRRLAVQVIAACRSLTQAADLLRLDWDSVQRLD